LSGLVLDYSLHFVPIPKDRLINPEKDFNPFGKAGMMMYCALLLDHFVNRIGSDQQQNLANEENNLKLNPTNFMFDPLKSTSENIVQYVHDMIIKLFLDEPAESEDSAYIEKQGQFSSDISSSRNISSSPRSPKTIESDGCSLNGRNSTSISCHSENSIDDGVVVVNNKNSSSKMQNSINNSNISESSILD
jgi:hypothetical protein